MIRFFPSKNRDLHVDGQPGECAGNRSLQGGDESARSVVDCRFYGCFEDGLQRCCIFFRIENGHGASYDLANFSAACTSGIEITPLSLRA